MIKQKIIMFDMDGTLIDSGSAIANTINYVRKHMGLDAMQKETMLAAINNPDINSSQFFYGTPEFTKIQTKLFEKYYDVNCTRDIVLYDGIRELLIELSEEFVLSVATNANSVYANKMLSFLRIHSYFSLIAGADMVEHPKPKGDMLNLTCAKLNIKKEDAILVGDSKKDFNAAKDFGIPSILVNWGFSYHKNIGNAIIANNIQDLKDRIKFLTTK